MFPFFFFFGALSCSAASLLLHTPPCPRKISRNNVCDPTPTPAVLTAVICTTLTLNSATLYTTENVKLVHTIPNLNCSELISQELGLINSSKTLVGLIPAYTDSSVTKTLLLLYFMKKTLHNSDGGNDLVTVVTLAHADVNKTLILSVLKKVLDKYFEFRQDLSHALNEAPAALGGASLPLWENVSRAKLGEFKLYMTQIIKFEEMQYDSNRSIYSYGSTGGEEGLEVITPNQLLAASGEVNEVSLLMLDNINMLLSRGDKLSLIVDQTDRLQLLSLVFYKGAKHIKRQQWWANARFVVSLVAVAIVLVYLFVGFECGYPFFHSCIRG